MWVVYLESFNDIAKFSTVNWFMVDTRNFYTHSLGAYDCGVLFGDE